MKQIAIYGKGGIGKSTITANVSVALAEKGYRVLQIGCDPKHDSTRLLLHGFMQNTVLQELKTKKPEAIRLEEVMLRGYRDICCIEAGGPEPGVGCAGRGIISMASLLETIGLKKDEFDFVIYDVLGDVVCGGFGVPMRDGYADQIFVVTSGEMMSIYAANNICKGIRNASRQRGKLAGVIGNSRSIENEEVLIDSFARRIGSRMVKFVHRDDLFRECELKSQTVMEYAPDSEIARAFHQLAEEVMVSEAVAPAPLSESELENFLVSFYRTAAAPAAAQPPVDSPPQPSEADSQQHNFDRYFQTRESPGHPAYLSKSVRNKEPLRSCALQGAFNVTSQVLDAISIMHSSINCSHIGFHAMLSVSKAFRTGHGKRPVPRLFSSNMGETEMVFGGEQLLGDSIVRLRGSLDPKAVFLINSCPAAIIGDDPQKIARIYGTDDCPVIAIPSDGVNGGDYAQGMLNAYLALAGRLIDPTVRTQRNLINLVGEKNASTVVDDNYRRIEALLGAMGLEVHCRFVRRSEVEQIRKYRRAPFSLLMETDDTAQTLRRFMEDQLAIQFIPASPPLGLYQTKIWIEEVADSYGADGANLVRDITARYLERVKELKPRLKGKRVLIFTYLQELDWLLETLLDLEMKIEKLCLYDSCVKESFSSRFSGLPVESGFEGSRRDGEIESCRPDLVLSNYLPPRLSEGVAYSVIPLCPQLGWSTGLDQAETWARNLRIPFVEGWRHDQKFFAALS